MPRRPRRSRLSAGLTLALLATGMVVVPSLPAAADTPVFVNELHYDNDGTDTGEFVEIAGPAGTDLGGWQLVLYNGSGETEYDTVTLTGTIPDTGGGFGQVVVDFPSNGIQNGGPDGLALVDPDGGVTQLLSYEGTFTAVGGPADGMTSTDIDVAEGSSTAVGDSLQLTGSGTTAGDFTWSGPTTATPGAANEGQAFVASGEPVPPAIGDCPDAIATPAGEATSATLSATDADSAITNAAITSPAVDGITLDGFTGAEAAGDTASATLTVADETDEGQYDVTVTFSTDDDPAQTVDCTTTVTVGTTPIHAVQGSGTTSPMDGTPVVVEAVVTSVLLGDEVGNQLGGIFVEEEASDRDDDAATSEGVFVYTGGLSRDLEVTTGDVVEVVGVVEERFDQTQVDASDGSVEVVDKAELPGAAIVDELPTTSEQARVEAFEPLEGMRVTLEGPWAVTESYALHQYGELELVPGTEPLQSPTNVLEPGEEAGAIEDAIGDGLLTLLLDDGRDINLSARTPMLPVPYVSDDGTGTIRRGSTTTDLTAVVGYGFGAYRLQPIDDDDTVEFAYAERPAVPEVGGDTRIATFNVLNYFNGNGDGTGFPTERGAHTPVELARQTDKIVSAMAELDADVLGLLEIENDGGRQPAIEDVVDALNAERGRPTYAAVHTGPVGDDAIRVALVHDRTTTKMLGFRVLDDVDPFNRNTRPAVAARFRDQDSGETFVTIVNHFKSKGSGVGDGNQDAGDGQGQSNADRVRAAEQLLEWIDTDPFFRPDDRVLILGDLNAYANEDPIDVLRDGGYTDLLDAFADGDREPYTYVYFGAEGRLDHALANGRALDDVTGAAAWHINADEPRSKDYNDDVITSCTAAEGCYDESTSYGDVNQPELYAPDAFRSSDHDPVLIGLEHDQRRARGRN